MAHIAVVSVVDDDESVRLALDSLLRSNGYTVQLFATAEAFLACGSALYTRCLISDIQMPGLSGIEMYDELCNRGTHIPIIFITGYQGSPPPVSPQSAAPVAYFPKPFSCRELLACIEAVVNRPD